MPELADFSLPPRLERAYIQAMMLVVGRGLVSASEVDEVIREEVAQFPVGFVVRMTIIPSGPDFTAQVQADGTLKLLTDFQGKPDLCAYFKHISHAFLVLSFQESIPRAFANDRLYVDGDVSHAIRLVRCLTRMETMILPKLVAERAVKRYPAILLGEKLNMAGRIYGRLLTNLLQGK